MSVKIFIAKPVIGSACVRNVSLRCLQAGAKFLKLQILPGLFSLKAQVEPAKIAFYSSHSISLLQAFIHLLPLGFCLTLIILNMKGVFQGDVSSSARTALQFAAKLLEVLIQTSIGSILLSLVRLFLVRDESLPLGALIAPLSVSNLAYCWSLDLWGSLSRFFECSWKARVLLACAPAFIALAAVVGPSSAVLLIPREMNTTAFIQHTLLDNSGTWKLAKIDSSMIDTVLTGETINQLALVYGVNECTDVLLTNTEETRGALCNLANRTYGYYAVPSRTTSRLLGGRLSIRDVTTNGMTYVTTRYPQPVIHYSCSDTYFTGITQLNKTFLDQAIFYYGVDYYGAGQTESVSLSSIITTDSINLNDSVWFKAFWAPSASHSINLATISWQLSETGTGDDKNPPITSNYRFWVQGCTFDAYWHNISATRAASSSSPGVITLDTLDEEPLEISIGYTIIDVSWAQHWSDLFDSYNSRLVDFDTAARFYSMVLSLAIADIAPSAEPQSFTLVGEPTNLTECQSDLINKAILKGTLNEGDLGMTTTNWTNLNQLFVQHMTVQHAGYGYNASGTTTQLSLAVLGLYSSVATIFLAYTLISGQTSGSWDSIGELLLLGLNSKRPSFLGRTSAGVETLNTYSQMVSVLVNEDDRLEIVFEQDPDHDRGLYRKPQVNQEY